jgi:hypothetical protein
MPEHIKNIQEFCQPAFSQHPHFLDQMGLRHEWRAQHEDRHDNKQGKGQSIDELHVQTL